MAKRKPTETAATGATDAAKISGSPMDVTLLEQIVKLMAANDLTGLEIRDGEKSVSLHRGSTMPAVSNAQMYLPRADQAGMAAAQATAGGTTAAPPDADAGLVPIKSPMVGTFYSASGPDAKAFVSVGSTVDEDTDVCIIEAMKVFNNIKAETRGSIAKIVVTNGQTVEFGQTLFLVKP